MVIRNCWNCNGRLMACSGKRKKCWPVTGAYRSKTFSEWPWKITIKDERNIADYIFDLDEFSCFLGAWANTMESAGTEIIIFKEISMRGSNIGRGTLLSLSNFDLRKRSSKWWYMWDEISIIAFIGLSSLEARSCNLLVLSFEKQRPSSVFVHSDFCLYSISSRRSI